MGLYDVNLKKTAIGYQFDHNVYIGYQINDNRVVTFKDLQGYASSAGGGSGGGGGGGINSVTLHANGQLLHLTVNEIAQGDVEVVVSELDATTVAAGSDAVICLVDPDDGKVYKTTQVWSDIASQLAALGYLDISKSGNTVTIAASSGELSINGTATKVGHALTLSVGSNTITYDGSAAKSLSLSTVGTTVAGTLSIATRGTASASDDAIPTIGYIKQSGLGGNLYSTADEPDGTKTSNEDTKFIFVEDN